MLPNAFIGQPERPADSDITAALGLTRPLWDALLADLAKDCDGQEWKSYSSKAGWSLRLLRGKRAIVYLSPGRGGFMASLALGDRAVDAAHNAGLPAKVVALIDGSRRYAEGTGVRIEVKSARDLPTIRKLATLKLRY